MPNPRAYRLPRSRSVSKSPLTSPSLEREDPWSRQVAFVPFKADAPSGVSDETRRAVRVQAAKASAAARKQTIARRLAERSGPPLSTGSSPPSPPESETRKVATSRSPSLSRKVSPVNATFTVYPITKWHPMIPAIVDYFTRHFLPDHHNASPDDVHGRNAMRTHLWPLALSDTCLFHAIMLISASHASVTGALAVPVSLLAQLKHTAIETINDVIAELDSSRIGDAVIAAIAFVGGWELEYGSPSTYDTHMGGLSAIMNSTPGGFVGAQAPLSPATINVVYTAGHDLALYASKRPYFDMPRAQTLPATPLLPSTLPIGFEELKAQHLVLHSFMQLISSLSSVLPEDPAARARLDEIEQALLEWKVENITATTYCPTRTVLEDVAIRQVYLHMRLAALAICGYTRFAMDTNAYEFLQSLYGEAMLLQSDLLIGTCFEELIFWCLIMISATSGRCEHKSMRSLKRLALELASDSWESARRRWTKFVYPDSIDSRAFALWQAVNTSTIAHDPSVGMGEPTRYAKGIGRPTTHIAALVAAAEG